jgi:hypothetical protein
MGYIGSTIWVDKGVKGLIPNGRNEDGTLKNIEFTTDNITTVNVVDDVKYFGIKIEDKIKAGVYGENLYDEETNTVRFNNVAHKWMYTGTLTCSNNQITSFNPKQTFRAVDYSEFNSTPHITETYQNGDSWYRVWSDGWCEQGGFINKDAASSYTIVTFLKPFATRPTRAVYNAAKPSGAYPSYHNLLFVCDSFTATTMSVFTKNSSNQLQTQYGYWYACGYIR